MSAQVLALPHTYLVFKFGSNEYGFEAKYLWEAAAEIRPTEIPLNESRLVGVTQLHGKIIPLLDLAGLVGEREVSGGEWVTVHIPGPPDILAGFPVSSIAGFVKVSAAEVLPPDGGGTETSYFQGRIDGEREILILGIEKIITGLIQKKIPASVNEEKMS